MYVPITPRGKKKGKTTKKTTPAQAFAAIVGGAFALAGLVLVIALDKGASIGLYELTIAGAALVLIVGGAAIYMRTQQDEEPKPRRGKDHRPID